MNLKKKFKRQEGQYQIIEKILSPEEQAELAESYIRVLKRWAERLPKEKLL